MKNIPKGIRENPNWTLNEVACFLLKRSCESARNRCMAGRKKYVNVRCNMTPAQLRMRLIEDKKFWTKWVDLTEKWIESGYLNANRPTLDRIDDNGHYEIGNIQALTHKVNTIKSNAKVCAIVTFIGNNEIEYEIIKGLNRTLESLGITRNEVIEENRNLAAGIEYTFFKVNVER